MSASAKSGANTRAKSAAKSGASSGQAAPSLQIPANWPAWVRGWHELMTAEGRDRDTRVSENYRFARAVILAHPDWGNKYVGRALGYDLDTCKNRGAYWRGRLATLGDLPEGADFPVQRLTADMRALLERDPDAAHLAAHRNCEKLPPIPPDLLEQLMDTDSPEECYRLLRKSRQRLELTHGAIPERFAPVRSAKQRAAADPEEPGEEGSIWGSALLIAAAVLGGLGALALHARTQAQAAAQATAQGLQDGIQDLQP